MKQLNIDWNALGVWIAAAGLCVTVISIVVGRFLAKERDMVILQEQFKSLKSDVEDLKEDVEDLKKKRR